MPRERIRALVTLVRTVQTGEAFPSQWDAWDADGNYYYLRYRNSRGTVRLYPKGGGRDVLLSAFTYGDPLSGIELDKFAELAGITVAD